MYWPNAAAGWSNGGTRLACRKAAHPACGTARSADASWRRRSSRKPSGYFAGLSWQNIRWAFESFDAANWHPLTWLSHMLDVQLFGMQAGYHHLTNLLLHLANTLLLFAFLNRLTGAFLRSGLVAALFGL